MLSCKKILIVDDTDGARMILSRMLKKHGYEVIEARNGKEALDLIRGDSAGLLGAITDLQMPVMDGAEFIRSLRAEGIALSFTILATSMSPTSDLVIAAVHGTSIPVIQKPCSEKTLLDLIQQQLASAPQKLR